MRKSFNVALQMSRVDQMSDSANLVNSSMLRRNYRKTAFSEAEKTVILAKVEEFRGVIASRFNDNTSNRQKQQKWEEIALDCSKVFPFHLRTGAEVKKKWENMITDAKRKLAIIENPPDGRPAGSLPQLNVADHKIIDILRSICQGYQQQSNSLLTGGQNCSNSEIFAFLEPKQENIEDLNFGLQQPSQLDSPCSSGSFNPTEGGMEEANVDTSSRLCYQSDPTGNQQGFAAVDHFAHLETEESPEANNCQKFSLAREVELLELEVMNLRRDKLRLEREKLRLEKAKLELDIAKLKAETNGSGNAINNGLDSQ